MTSMVQVVLVYSRGIPAWQSCSLRVKEIPNKELATYGALLTESNNVCAFAHYLPRAYYICYIYINYICII